MGPLVGTILIMLVTGVCTAAVFVIWPIRTRATSQPQPILAREIREHPRPLPAKDHGEVAQLQALVWMEGVADIAAFTLLELGHVATKAEAIEAGRRVACAWHDVEPGSVPWRDRSNTK